MNMLEIFAILAGLIISWLILRKIVKRKLDKDTARRKAETERLEKEIYHKKEMKKHLGFHAMEREEFTPSLSEEDSEAQGYPSSSVMDEEDTENS